MLAAKHSPAIYRSNDRFSPSTLRRELAIEIGRKVNNARVKQSLSLGELSAKANLSCPRLQGIEMGWRRVAAEELWDLCQALHLTVAYFFDLEPEIASTTLPRNSQHPPSPMLDRFVEPPDRAVGECILGLRRH